MKIHTTGAALSSAVSWVAKMAPHKPMTPVLAGVLIEANQELRLFATDRNTFGTVLVAGTVAELGSAVVSAKLFGEIGGLIPADADVTITGGGGERVTITAGRGRWTLPVIDPDEWPSFPQLGDQIGEISGDAFRTALSKVISVVPAEHKGMSVLCGVRITPGESLNLTATDGLQVSTIDAEWKSTDPADEMVVPPDALKKVADFTASGTSVAMFSSETVVGFASDRFTVMTSVVAGQYPNLDRMLALPLDTAETTVVVDVAEFSSAISKVMPGMKEFDPIVIEFDEEINISQPDANQVIDVVSIAGPSLTVGIKPRLLRDALSFIGSGDCQVVVPKEPRKSMLIRPVDKTGKVIEGNRQLVMLVNLAKAGAKTENGAT